jgi:hypothetical protein
MKLINIMIFDKKKFNRSISDKRSLMEIFFIWYLFVKNQKFIHEWDRFFHNEIRLNGNLGSKYKWGCLIYINTIFVANEMEAVY